jgi:hypothetical protein
LRRSAGIDRGLGLDEELRATDAATAGRRAQCGRMLPSVRPLMQRWSCEPVWEFADQAATQLRRQARRRVYQLVAMMRGKSE